MSKKMWMKMLFCITAVAIMAGCAGKASWYGNEADGFVLQYHFPTDKVLNYDANFDMSITLERGDQEQTASAVADAVFGMQGKSINKEMDIQTVNVWAEKLEGKLQTGSGWKSRSLDKVLNKPFQIDIKPNGEVTGFGNTDSLRIGLDLNGPGRFNVKDFFVYYLGNYFLKLPAEPKRIGDTWDLEESITQDLGGIALTVEGMHNSTLVGYENVDGVKCLKIDVEVESILEGGDESGQMVVEGDFGGDAVLYYDYMNGRIVKYEYDMFGEATAAVGGGTFSYGIENKMVVSLQR